MKIEIQKAVSELNLLTATLTTMNNQLECLLYDLRHNNGLCVECGRPVEDVGDEYCRACYNDARTVHEDMWRDLQRDQKVS